MFLPTTQPLRRSHKRDVTVQLVKLLPDPSNRLSSSSNDAKTTCEPQPCHQSSNAIDSIPPPLPLQSLVLRVRRDLIGLPAHPVGDTPGKMPHAGADESGEAGKRDKRMRRKAVAYVRQRDQTAIAMHVHGQDTSGPDVEGGEWEEGIAEQTGAAEGGPGDGALVSARLGAIALQSLAAAVQAQCHAAGDVGEERKRNDERLCQGGLVVRPCEEEVAIRLGDGAGCEGDQGCVCDVEGGEDAEGVGRVLLDACHCRVSVFLLACRR